jgi:hypothetical protein
LQTEERDERGERDNESEKRVREMRGERERMKVRRE